MMTSLLSKDSAGKAIVLIPARMQSTRLPGKPLALIGGEPMIVHVWRRAMEADVGPVVVACAEEEIRQAIDKVGGLAVMTDPDLPSGTDRIRQALDSVDPDRRFQLVINMQGDLPTLEPQLLRDVLRPIEELGSAIGTLVVATDDLEERNDPSVVKAIIAVDPDHPGLGRALYFTRSTAPSGDGPVLHHIGIYSFRRETLDRFAALPPSPLEQRERLEQLRALEAGIPIGAAFINTVPLGVDTPADLARARGILGSPAAPEGPPK